MRRAAALLLALVPLSAPAQGALKAFEQPIAQGGPGTGDFPPLAEALNGATAVTTLANGYVLVTRPDASFICAINLNPSYFVALAQGTDPEGRVLPPGALCVPTDRVANLGSGL